MKKTHHWSSNDVDKVKDLTIQGYTSVEVARMMSEFLGEDISPNSIERVRKTYGISVRENKIKDGDKTHAGKEVLRESSEVEGDKWAIALPKTRIHTLEELVEYCKIDLTIWEVERFICNKWEVGMKLEKGGTSAVLPLFQVKAFLRKKKNIVDARAELESLKKLALGFKAPSVKVSKGAKVGNNLLEICIADHHFGKLAWGSETGHGNYDVKIAKDLFNKAVDSLLDRTRQHLFEEVLFIVGNDLLNSDDSENMTTLGTPQTTDGRYQKTFAVVRTLMIETIEKLRNIAPVKVMMISGNHDRLSVWHLGDSLECWFHKYTDVSVDNRPLLRKYHRFGNVMLMFTHGDKGKLADYPLLMATEQPQMFGGTKFREIHTAHTHQVSLKEKNGVRVRILPTLGKPDDWHSERGFVGNIRGAEGYIWNKKEGLIGMAFYSDVDTYCKDEI